MKRILVWGLSNRRAGTETVIANYASVLRNQQFDFLSYEEPSNFSALFEGTGNRYFVIPHKMKSPLGYQRALHKFLQQHAGEHEALWFNTNHAANIDLLTLSERFGIPRRIVHSHNSQDPQEIYLRALARLNIDKLRSLGTDFWACSEQAGRYLFGSQKFVIVPNVVDQNDSQFDARARTDMREQLGVTNSFVIGTVGRLNIQKNQKFIVELLPAILERIPNAIFAIVGNGELRQEISNRAKNLGVQDHLILFGNRPDVRKLLSSFDVFVMPSIYEGLPLALLEAQFNGLPCIVSDQVEATARISSAVIFLPLQRECWVEAICNAHRPKGSFLLQNASMYSLQGCATRAEQLFK